MPDKPVLYPYQRKYIDDASRFKIAMFARQTGKTFTSTLEIAEDFVACETSRKRTRWVILSRGERQAREAMDEGLKPHLRAIGAAFQAYDADFRLEDSTTVKAMEVIGKHGSRVTALPASPDTARGFSANVFLDEFAFHADSRKIWQALFPVISKPGLRLRVVSTPNGKGNRFYELMTSETGAWSKHVVDIYTAVADGLPRDIEELRIGCGDADAWAQEYELQWLDEAHAWLPYDLINAAEDDAAGLPNLYTGGPCFIGVDIAARRDLFVIWVLEAVGDVLWTREIITRKGASFQEQDDLLDGAYRRYRVVRSAHDQTGMGEKPVEDAQRRHGASRVSGVLFTNANKQLLATEFKQAFEDRKIRIPMGDNALRADLHKVQREVGPTGIPRFLADADSEGHADRFWAGALACHAAATPPRVYAYRPAAPEQNPRRPRDEEDDSPLRADKCRFGRGAW
jgi:phage FluMu gp28-like protein